MLRESIVSQSKRIYTKLTRASVSFSSNVDFPGVEGHLCQFGRYVTFSTKILIPFSGTPLRIIWINWIRSAGKNHD